MEQQLEIIREQQRTSWNKFSPGWKKWDEMFMNFLKPMGDEIIQQLNPENDDVVLDIASGTGEPGLTIASMIRNGKVIITDLAEGMVEIAKENALLRGLNNIEALTCDVSEIPFVDNSFDAVSCRFGFMFFPDMQLAANEMHRVLKPGGRIATSVWNVPEKNFWITAMMGTINQHIELPAPPPGSPGMFRCSKEELMADIFRKAGFNNVTVTEVSSKMDCGTADLYWKVMTEVAAPVVAALGNADEQLKEKIKTEVYLAINKRYPLQHIKVDASALIIYGEK